MPTHASLTGSDLHDPQGYSSSLLTLPNGVAGAFKIQASIDPVFDMFAINTDTPALIFAELVIDTEGGEISTGSNGITFASPIGLGETKDLPDSGHIQLYLREVDQGDGTVSSELFAANSLREMQLSNPQEQRAFATDKSLSRRGRTFSTSSTDPVTVLNIPGPSEIISGSQAPGNDQGAGIARVVCAGFISTSNNMWFDGEVEWHWTGTGSISTTDADIPVPSSGGSGDLGTSTLEIAAGSEDGSVDLILTPSTATSTDWWLYIDWTY